MISRAIFIVFLAFSLMLWVVNHSLQLSIRSRAPFRIRSILGSSSSRSRISLPSVGMPVSTILVEGVRIRKALRRFIRLTTSAKTLTGMLLFSAIGYWLTEFQLVQVGEAGYGLKVSQLQFIQTYQLFLYVLMYSVPKAGFTLSISGWVMLLFRRLALRRWVSWLRNM